MSSLMKTEAIYTKREAEFWAASKKTDHGGYWSVEQVGRKWRAVQEISKRDFDRANTQNAANAALQFSYWDNRFGAAREIERLKEKLDKFAADFVKDPLYTMSRATDVVQHAAEYKVLGEMTYQHERGVSDQEIVRALEQEAGRRGEYESLSHSTSPMSNLAEHAEHIAYRKYAKQFRDWVNHRQQAVGDLYALEMGLL